MERIIKLDMQAAVVPCKKQVAAYARVSSGKDAMLHSLSAQIAFYSAFIQKHSEWEYVGVYADEALTGTKEDRPEFQRMMEDCKNGRIDIVLTKSLSRFARNTVTTLETIRLLRNWGVDVWFERENIHSLAAEGEFLISILASFAQEESLSASENQKWKIRKNFSEGIPTSNIMLGYETIDGVLTIIPNEAETVRMIYYDYLSGLGTNAIVRKLRSNGVPTKLGGEWRENVIHAILTNEKYKGDMLLQKTFRPDHISKKTRMNNGELPQYYVQASHEPIVPPEIFDQVQIELVRRSPGKKNTPVALYPFSGKIVCEKCGKHFKRKKTKAGVRWCCRTFDVYGKEYCDAKQIPDAVLTSIIGDRNFQRIHVPDDGIIRVIWADGSESVHTWENPSRAESWTVEMRHNAAERTKIWHQNR